MILNELPSWRRTKKRKPIVSSKYYFFDVGIVSVLQGREFRQGTPEFGEALETYMMHELICYSDYISGEPPTYWRSTSGFEVDFILGDHTAIEVKAKENISLYDIKSLKALAEEGILKRFICVSLEKRARTYEGVTILPYRKFLEALWAGEYSG